MNNKLFGTWMTLGKQKTPGGIPCGVFCFPTGKQKTPGGEVQSKLLENRILLTSF